MYPITSHGVHILNTVKAYVYFGRMISLWTVKY